MAKRIAKFEKVSFTQFKEGWMDTFGEASEEKLREIYGGIRLPRRATKGSAGYDFFAPADFTLRPGETVKIPTGIRAKMEEEWVLKCYPRSGLGFKYRLQLNNTVGIIDSDYYYSDTFSPSSPTIPTRERRWRSPRGQALCRVSLWSTASRWTTRRRVSATAALEAPASLA